jgi:hypothetical protein
MYSSALPSAKSVNRLSLFDKKAIDGQTAPLEFQGAVCGKDRRSVKKRRNASDRALAGAGV